MKILIAEVWATAFYVGLVPKAPGTAGSLVGVLLAFLLQQYLYFTGWHLAALAAVLLLPSVWAATVLIGATGQKDPQVIVMDEVLGQLIVFAALGWNETSPLAYVLAFALFRFFDIAKPFPVRALERLPQGWGVMVDDYAAGLWGAAVLWSLRTFSGLPL